MRRFILKWQGKMDGELILDSTANGLLSNIGNAIFGKALIRRIYEEQGLQAAFN